MINTEFIENKIGYIFKDKSFLTKAFTHSSYSNNVEENYEMLEFLGDSLINFFVGEELMKRFKKLDEGEVTRLRSLIVSKGPLSKIIQELELNQFLIVKEEENQEEIASQTKIQCNIFESLIAAIYLDSEDVNKAKSVTINLLDKTIEESIKNKNDFKDYKSELIIYCQKNNMNINFNCLNDNFYNNIHEFTVEANINGESFGVGIAKNKKEAEKIAAFNAMKKLEIL